jgi:filamentous hemagglutinin family protein
MAKVRDFRHLAGLWIPLVLIPGAAIAQITPDNTLGQEASRLIRKDSIEQIEGGATRGVNLFHSFQDFNIGAEQRVYFANPAGISNILTRVTGSNVSNIFGQLGVQGTANLFLLNPNGILFGPNARLDIAGSFVASAGSRFTFPDGTEFSAIAPQAPPLLTVSVPVGVQLGTTGNITNQGFLAVGQDLTLAGNQLDLQGLLLTGGNTTLQAQGDITLGYYGGASLQMVAGGSVTADEIWIAGTNSSAAISAERNSEGTAETVTLSNGTRLELDRNTQPTLDVRAGVLINPSTNTATSAAINLNNVIVSAPDGKVLITNQYLKNSQLEGAIAIGKIATNGDERDAFGNTGSVFVDARGDLAFQQGVKTFSSQGKTGTVTLLANGNLSLAPGADLSTPTFSDGDAGDINIQARSLTLDKAFLINSTLGQGKGGDINLTIQDGMSMINGAGIDNRAFAEGDAGDINVQARSLSLDRAFIANRAESEAQGRSGDINLTIQENLALNDSSLMSSTGGQGAGGDINLTIQGGISLTNDSRIDNRTFANGKAGDINIQARSYTANSSYILGGSYGSGNSGDINLKIQEDINLISVGTIDARVLAEGEAGDINIEARSLLLDGTLSAGAEGFTFINTSTLGPSKGGDILIKARGQVVIRNDARITAEAAGDAEGGAGNITIEAAQVIAERQGQILTSAESGEDGGEITVRAKDKIRLAEESIITTNAIGSGKSGNVLLETANLEVVADSTITTFAFGLGNAGNITLKTTDQIVLDQSEILSSTVGLGAGGVVSVETGKLSLQNNASISTNTFGSQFEGLLSSNKLDTDSLELITLVSQILNILGRRIKQGDSGDLLIRARESVEILDNSFLSSAANDKANGGRILIESPQLRIDNAGVTTTTNGSGKAGALQVLGAELVQISNGSLIAETSENSSGSGGDMTIDTQRLVVQNQGTVSASTNGTGRGGTLKINAPKEISLSNNSRLAVEATNSSTAGSLTVETARFTLNDSQATVSSQAGAAGNLAIAANQIFLNNSRLTAETAQIGNEGANINLQNVDLLLMRRGSQISARASNDANGGNIMIDTSQGFVIAVPGENNDIIASANQGRGGNIQITTQGIFGLQEGRATSDNLTNDIDASSQFGSQGTVAILEPNIDPERGLIELPTNLSDRTDQINPNCRINLGGSQSEFIVTGRGGLPTSPMQPLNSQDTVGEWVTLNPTLTKLPASIANATPKLVEAEALVVNSRGEVELVAHSTSPASVFTSAYLAQQLKAPTDQDELSTVRQTVESLQVAELQNFCEKNLRRLPGKDHTSCRY